MFNKELLTGLYYELSVELKELAPPTTNLDILRKCFSVIELGLPLDRNGSVIKWEEINNSESVSAYSTININDTKIPIIVWVISSPEESCWVDISVTTTTISNYDLSLKCMDVIFKEILDKIINHFEVLLAIIGEEVGASMSLQEIINGHSIPNNVVYINKEEHEIRHY